MLSEINIEPERLQRVWVSASEGKKFAETIAGMVEELRRLGPIRLRVRG
jgi:coenzyme F420-reducing hydrogenase delta subunit